MTGSSLSVGIEAAAKPADSLVTPGLAGFLVTFALAIATFFLIRSMVKHLRKVRYGPDPLSPGVSGPGPSGPGPSGPGPSGPGPSPPGEVPQPRSRSQHGDA